MKHVTRLFTIASLCLSACATTSSTPSSPNGATPALDIFAEMAKGPGNLTVMGDGTVVASLHEFFGDAVRVAAVAKDGATTEFAAAAKVNSVLGLQADATGTVWLLDNGRRGAKKRRLVGWKAGAVTADIDLTGVSPDNAFLNDLAVDVKRRVAYIADPAGGANAAIIVVDLAKGSARRVLQGHKSVIPEELDLVIDGTPVRIKRPDGSELRPRVGINPIALDTANEWLYYGPMHGLSMYRVRASDLRDAALAADALTAKVERYADKPICDGISIDNVGNIYLGDLAANAIGVISADRKYRVLIADQRLSWVDAFSFGPDGYLYIVVNQLHRSAVLNHGVDATVKPYLIARFRPLAKGTPGR